MTTGQLAPAPPRPPSARPAAAPRRGAGARGRRVNLLLLPAALLFAVFLAWPLVDGFRLSLTDWNGYSPEHGAVGAANYLRLFGDDVFLRALGNTFVYGLGSTAIQQVLGLALAVALNRAFRGRGLARTIVYLPVLVSPVVMGTMYYLFFRYTNGSLNDVVGLFGVEPVAWLSNASLSVGIVVLVNSLQFVGISMVIYLAGLQAIPDDVLEAAELDGATGFARFRSVILPLLQPAFATSVVINLIGGLKLFDVVVVMTGGGPGYATESVSTLISASYFDDERAGYASAMGVVLFLVIAAFTLVLNTALNRTRLEQA